MAEEKSQNLEKKVVSGMFWKFLEQISYQGIQLLFSIVLLRLLTKEDVGAVGIISIFISIANSLIQTGFSQALMQKKEIKAVDYSTALFSSLLLAGLLYLVFFFLVLQDFILLVPLFSSLVFLFSCVPTLDFISFHSEMSL